MSTTLQTHQQSYPWTLSEVSNFAALVNPPIYKTLVAIFFRNGIIVSDYELSSYGDIKKEYEADTVPLCLDFTQIKPQSTYLTFLGETGVNMLHEYIYTR